MIFPEHHMHGSLRCGTSWRIDESTHLAFARKNTEDLVIMELLIL